MSMNAHAPLKRAWTAFLFVAGCLAAAWLGLAGSVRAQTVAPSIVLIHPVDQQAVSGLVDLTAETSQPAGKVVFAIKGPAAVGPFTVTQYAKTSSGTYRYQYGWDTTNLAAGAYQMVASMYLIDPTTGLVSTTSAASSATITVNLGGTTAGPTVTVGNIVQPIVQGDKVSLTCLSDAQVASMAITVSDAKGNKVSAGSYATASKVTVNNLYLYKYEHVWLTSTVNPAGQYGLTCAWKTAAGSTGSIGDSFSLSAPTPHVNWDQPTATTFSDVVLATAHADVQPSKVGFSLTNLSQTNLTPIILSGLTVSPVTTSSGTVWQWSAKQAPPSGWQAGDVIEVAVMADFGSQTAPSLPGPKQLTYQPTATAPTGITVDWLNPGPGDTLVGYVDLDVNTDPPAQSVSFQLVDPVTQKYILTTAWNGTQSADPNSPGLFSYGWDTSKVPDGKYQLLAQAFWNGTKLGQASRDVITQQTSTTTPPALVITEPIEGVALYPTAQLLQAKLEAAPVSQTAYVRFLMYRQDQDSSGKTVSVLEKDWPGMDVSGRILWETEVNPGSDLKGGTYNLVAELYDPASGQVLAKATAYSLTAQSTSTSSDLIVELTAPVDAATVSQVVPIKATTNLKAEGIKVQALAIGSSSGQGSVPTVQLTLASSQIISSTLTEYYWEGSLDTVAKGLPDGSYRLTATAVLGTGQATDYVDVKLANGTVTPVPATVKIVQPTDLTATYSKTVKLVAQVAGGTPDAVAFKAVNAQTGQTVDGQASLGLTTGLWSYVWDTTAIDNGDWKVVALAAAKGQALGQSEPIGLKVQNELLLSVVLTSPPAEVSGIASIGAFTSIPAKSVTFQITPQEATQKSVLDKQAVSDSGGQNWSAPWDTTEASEGVYVIKAVALTDTQKVVSDKPLAVTVKNGSLTATQPPPASVSLAIVSPQAGETVLKAFELKAKTSAKVGSVRFTVLDSSGRVVATQTGAAAAGGLEWSQTLDSRGLPDGKYRLGAEAFISLTSVGKAEPVGFIIGNGTAATTTTTTAGGTETTAVGTAGDTQTAALTTTATSDSGDFQPPDGSLTTSPESISTTGLSTLPPTIKITTQPGTVAGLVVLKASASGNTGKVAFNAYNETSGKSVVLLAAQRSDGSWNALWRTTDGPDGRYAVRVRAFASDSALNATAGPVYLSVANQVAGSPTSPTAAGSAPEAGQSTAPDDGSAAAPAVTKVSLSTVTVLDQAVAKEAVRSAPANVSLIELTAPASAAGQTDEVDSECQKAGIAADKCQTWLAWQNRQGNDCRAAGILTKQECLGYLKKKTGQAPTGQDAARKTAGLLEASQLNELEEAVLPLIGQTVAVSRATPVGKPSGGRPGATEPESSTPAGQPSAAAPSASAPAAGQPADLGRYLPVKLDQTKSFRVLASSLYVENDQGTLQKQVPAMVMADTDGDGLPDDTEKRLGTDPDKADTDGDGYDDLTEIKNGYDPRGPGRLGQSGSDQVSPVDAAIVAGALIEQPKSAGRTSAFLTVDKVETFGSAVGQPDQAAPQAGDETQPDQAAPLMRLSGQGRPGQTVTIYVYSYLPMVLTTTVDSDGTWSYDMSASLTDGEHTAYVAVNDDTGKIQAKSEPLPFLVSQAQAATEDEFFTPAAMQAMAEAPVNRLFVWYLVAAAVLVLGGVVVGGMIFTRALNKHRGSF